MPITSSDSSVLNGAAATSVAAGALLGWIGAQLSVSLSLRAFD